MKAVSVAILLLGLTSVAVFGQGRPRVAPTPTPLPAATTNRDDGPPVLGGPNGARPNAAKPTPTPVKDGEDEVIRVETNLVTMPVSVLDRDGRFISGLQQKDFQIFENNVPQKIEYFASTETPFTVVMLLDVSPSTQWQIEDIQNAAITFVNQLRPVDKVEVIAFDEKVHVLTQPTNNRNVLRQAIQTSEIGDGTGLYEAVDFALNQEMRKIQGRKAVVLFTDGVDTTSRRATYDGTLADVEESDGLFYTIRYDTSSDMGNGGGWGGGNGGGGNIPRQGGGWGSIIGIIVQGGSVPGSAPGRTGRRGGVWSRGGGQRGDYAKGKAYLEGLAQNSGGREFEAGTLQNLDAAFSGIAEELRRQYSVGYYPATVGQLGERRQIRIRVMRPDVVVRAKNSYVVGETNRTVAGK